MKAKALLITDVTAPGGVDTYFCELYKAAVDAGWQAEVMIDQHAGGDFLFEMLRELSAPITRAPLYHRLHPESARAKATQKVIDRFAPRIVHAVCGAPWTTVAPREVVLQNNVPLIFTEQFVAEGFTFEPLLHQRIENLYSRAKAVIAVSRNNAALLTEDYRFCGDRLIVIPNAVRTDLPCALPKEKIEAIRRHLSLPERQYHAVTVARLAEQKGLDLLIEGIAKVPRPLLAQIHFSIIGSGPDKAALKDLAEMRNVDAHLSFLGWQDQVRQMLPAFDLFILPSRSEGQPFALIEALAAKMPTIAFAVSGIPELLDHGKGGELINSGATSELADAIASFVKDPWPLRKKAEHGYAHVRRHHDIRKNMQKTLALWEAALHGQRFPSKLSGDIYAGRAPC